jgi:hypothetical protein
LSPKSPMPTRKVRSTRPWRWYCILAALEAGAAIAFLVALPREGSGFSLARIGVLAFLLSALLFFGTAAARQMEPPSRLLQYVLPISAILAFVAAVVLYLLRYLNPASLLPYYQRLSIPVLYVLVLCLQTLAVLAFPHFRASAVEARRALRNLPGAGLVWLILLLILGIVALTGFGITPDPAYWGEPGVPILGWQLAFAILCAALTMLLSLRVARLSRLDIALSVAIWLLAVAAWLAVPLDVLQNSFYAPIRPPANVPFPNSDAGYYDSMAHSLLIGYPYLGEIPARPLYVLLLSVFHVLFGERYDLIIAAQTLVLALIPVVLFWLGSAIHSRPAGVIVGIAAIGREWTSLMVSSATRVSNTKMLLADVPTLLVMLLCCWLTLRWLTHKDTRAAAIAGGSYAMLLLLRTQTLALLPILLLFGVLAIGIRRRATYVQLAVFCATTVVTLSPWLIHNFMVTGQVALDAPFQYRIIASQYRYTGNLDIQNVDLEGKSILGILAAFAARDPAFVLGFIANHALATQVSGVLALPRFHSSPGLLAGVEPYWADWNGTLGSPNLLLVVIYLGIIALGLVAAWSRLRWAGLLPLGMSLGYSLANGIARFSGWRYNLPADWIAYFYFAVGVAEILIIVAASLGVKAPSVQPHATGTPDQKPGQAVRLIVGICLAFALIGALPWIGARLAAPRYGWAAPESLASRLSTSRAVNLAGITSEEIARARIGAGAVLEVGRVLYPRFFTRGTGLASAHPWPAYAPRDFPRLGFLLLNATRHDVLLPTRLIPQGLNHAVDAIVLGCQRDDYLEARLVLLPESDILIQVAPLSESCE